MKKTSIFTDALKVAAICPLALLAGCAGAGAQRGAGSAADEIAAAIAISAGRANAPVEYDASLSAAAAKNNGAAAGTAARSRAARRLAQDSILPSISGELSLVDSITLALANNHDIESARLASRAAGGLIDQAYAEAMPFAALSANAQNNFSADEFNDTYGLGVRVTQPLFRSGAIAAGLRYAKYYSASTDFTVRERVSDTICAVSERYLSVLLNEQLALVAEDAAAVAERMLQTAKSRKNQGVATEYEALRAEVEIAKSRADLINASNALRRAQISLFDTMGVSQQSSVSLAGKLAYEPEGFDEEALYERAALGRPDILRAQAAVLMARENIGIVESDYRVKIDAFGSAGYNNSKRGDWDDEAIAGATASLQLYDGFRKRGRIAVAESELEQAKVSLRKAQDAARIEVVNALLQLKHAAELYESQKRNIDVAREALRMIESGSRQGRNTQVEVLDARAALTDAMGAYYRAIHAHALAKIAVRDAAGLLNAATPSAAEAPAAL